jgi:hypothetical protein
MLGRRKGLLLNRFDQNEMMGTYQMKSLTCTPRKNQSHRTARDSKTTIVRRVSPVSDPSKPYHLVAVDKLFLFL